MTGKGSGRFAFRIGGIVGRSCGLSLILVLCLLAAKFPDYPVREAGDYSISAEKSGITMGVQPVEDLKEESIYFKAPLRRQGLLPVLVVIQNRSSAYSFLFDRKRMTYELVTTSRERRPSFLDWLVRNGNLGSVENVNENMLKKELMSKTLSPGVFVHGFLYIRVANLYKGFDGTLASSSSPRPKIRLQVPFSRAGSDEIVVMEVVF